MSDDEHAGAGTKPGVENRPAGENTPVLSKSEAQRRVDRILDFRRELQALDDAGVLRLDESRRQAVTVYHQRLIEQFAAAFDVDVSRREKQLGLGMKIAAFIGALGLAASVFFLFYQFWGRFSTTAQVSVLMAAPLLVLALAMCIGGRDKSGYFVRLLCMLGLTCFVLNVSMLGQIFNIIPSPNAFLIWAALAFLLAYAADARLMLAMGIVMMAGFLSALMGTWGGCYWMDFGERPENFLPAACLCFAASLWPQRRFAGFPAIYRIFGLLLFFVPVLVLANWGRISYLRFDPVTVEVLYQLVGFAGSAAVIWLGVVKNWSDTVNTGNVFFAIFLYTKFYDWWWDWMPKYLFFLLVGLTAVLMLLIFKRLRAVAAGRNPEAL